MSYSDRVLLADPRREARLLRFIGLPEVGRVTDEVDAEEERAVRLDGWVAWEAEDPSSPLFARRSGKAPRSVTTTYLS